MYLTCLCVIVDVNWLNIILSPAKVGVIFGEVVAVRLILFANAGKSSKRHMSSL